MAAVDRDMDMVRLFIEAHEETIGYAQRWLKQTREMGEQMRRGRLSADFVLDSLRHQSEAYALMLGETQERLRRIIEKRLSDAQAREAYEKLRANAAQEPGSAG